MEALGVIAKVQELTEWCEGMVIIPKTNGKVQICVDLTNLTQSVRRERHLLPAVDQTLAQLAGAKMFSKLDANSGFWQIRLASESAQLTTLITPFGRCSLRNSPLSSLHSGVCATHHFHHSIRESAQLTTFITPFGRCSLRNSPLSSLHSGNVVCATHHFHHSIRAM